MRAPGSILRKYDAAIVAAIQAIETTPDGDWQPGADFFGEGFHAVADLFRTLFTMCQNMPED